MAGVVPGDDDAWLLSPLEQIFSGSGSFGITLIFNFSAILDRARLQESLAQTVERFPWVWCELEMVPEQRGFRLVPRKDPVLLEEGNAGPAVREKEKFVGPLETPSRRFLARFCLTDTPSGSVLGIRMSHTIADGSSLFHFLISWAQLTRGVAIFAPVRRRIPTSNEGMDDRKAQQVLSDYGLFHETAREPVDPESLKDDIFYFSSAEVAALREQAQRESGAKLSVNDVLMAHIWQRFGPGWCEEVGGAESILSCPVDMRSVSNLPGNHFGCVLGFAVAKLAPMQLRQASLGELATRVRRAVESANTDSLARASEALEHLRRAHGVSRVQDLQIQHPRGGILYTNLLRAPKLELDFGNGPPTSLVCDASVYHAGALFPHPDGVEIRAMPRPRQA